jgi:DNA-binding CsgD family transcriptional regulator
LVTVNELGTLLAHPLFGEVVLAGLSSVDAEHSRLAAARLLETGSSTEATHYRVLCLRLGTAEQSDAVDLTWAAGYANWLGDRAMSLRFAVAAVAVDRGPKTMARQATALSMVQRWDEAEQSFEAATDLVVTDDDRVMVAAAYGSYLAFNRGFARAAVDLGSSTMKLVESEEHRRELQTHLDKWQLLAGDEKVTSDGSADAARVTTVDEAILVAMRAIFVGDIGAATAAIAAGTPLMAAGRGLAPHARQLFDFVQIFIFIYSGQMAEARELANAEMTDPFSDMSATFEFATGLMELYAGNAERSIPLARSAVDGLEWSDIAGMRMPARALLAAASARLGDEATAIEQLDALDVGMHLNGTVMAQSSEARAWILAHHSRYAAAAEIVATAARTLAERGHWGVAASTAYVAVRLGRAETVAELLNTAVSNAPGPLLLAMNQHAAASLQNDPTALVEAAAALAATGQYGPAVDAADEAAALYRSRSDSERERLAAKRAAEYASLSSDFRLRRPRDLSITLTGRERDIAEAAAGRESSREIAERLGLSVRTVETHLANVYRKLGVSSRADLRKEL